MLQLFTRLTMMFEASAFFALTASFIWGILSIVLSPCHLAGIPLIMAHIVQKGDGSKKKAGMLALLFALGILATLLIIGLITSILGRIAGDTGSVPAYAVGGVIIFFGIYLTGLLPFNLFNYSVTVKTPGTGFFQSFLFGLIFGSALGPCSFAFMAPILAVCFRTAGTRYLFSFSLIALFALGHCAVIMTAGILTETVRSLLKWNEKTGALEISKKIFGGLAAAAGVFLILNELLK